MVGASLVLAGAAAAAPAPRPSVDRFDAKAAMGWVERQLAYGPRPAGSEASRQLARTLRQALPNGRFQPVPDGLRNVVGVVRGRDPRRRVVVGAHYDTKDLPDFLGANDGASGTAVVVPLARTIRPRTLEPTIVFVLFDGEESPDDLGSFYEEGLRGSKVAASVFRDAEAMVLLDMIGDPDLSIPFETSSDDRLWTMLRAAAGRIGVASVFPPQTTGPILDDHTPFLRADVPAIDLIDFDFACWHRLCDDRSKVSVRSLDAVGETVFELLRSYR